MVIAQRYWMGSFGHAVLRRDDSGFTAREWAARGGHAEAEAALVAAELRVVARGGELAREDERAAPRPCCNGCGFVDRADVIIVHEVNSCPRRVLGCTLCGEQMAADLLEAPSLR